MEEQRSKGIPLKSCSQMAQGYCLFDFHLKQNIPDMTDLKSSWEPHLRMAASLCYYREMLGMDRCILVAIARENLCIGSERYLGMDDR